MGSEEMARKSEEIVRVSGDEKKKLPIWTE